MNVVLGANRLILEDGTDKKSSITYSNIVRISPSVKTTKAWATDPTQTQDIRWRVWITTRTNTIEQIPLGEVQDQPTWTNDQAGYNNAEAAIYGAFT